MNIQSKKSPTSIADIKQRKAQTARQKKAEKIVRQFAKLTDSFQKRDESRADLAPNEPKVALDECRTAPIWVKALRNFGLVATFGLASILNNPFRSDIEVTGVAEFHQEELMSLEARTEKVESFCAPFPSFDSDYNYKMKAANDGTKTYQLSNLRERFTVTEKDGVITMTEGKVTNYSGGWREYTG